MNGAPPWDLALLVGVLVANRSLVRWIPHPLFFWSFQVVLAGCAAWFAVRGVQGLESVAAVRWLVSGLLVFHLVQNVVVRRGGKKL